MFLTLEVRDFCLHCFNFLKGGLVGKLFQSYPTLCNPMDCSLPGSSVHGILQARTVEWVAMPSSRESSLPRDQTYLLHLLCWQASSLPLALPGKPPKEGGFIYFKEKTLDA